MNKEEFIKQRCEIDKITEKEFEKRYRVVKCNCEQSYCKGYRCLDLDDLLEENQKYKEVIDKVSSQIKLYGKYNGEKCTRGFSMMSADFNKLLEILKEVK